MQPKDLPTQPPAVGGWYWDTSTNHMKFLMPPFPGVDDAIMTPYGLAYRSLVERDSAQRAQAQKSPTILCEQLSDMSRGATYRPSIVRSNQPYQPKRIKTNPQRNPRT